MLNKPIDYLSSPARVAAGFLPAVGQDGLIELSELISVEMDWKWIGLDYIGVFTYP